MGFGFSDKKEDEEDSKPKHNVYNSLRFKEWKDLSIGMKVQSAVNGVFGEISDLDNQYFIVEISWDNGNKSSVRRTSLSNVIPAE